jgi:2-amino-4-hydroxy-6-hydroxymethyldihydropteridine diphosphokinase
MNGIFLIIGGNLGNRIQCLKQGREAIEQQIGRILQSSSIYETAAWGQTDAPPYLNQVLWVDTSLSPEKLLQTALDIESSAGRTRLKKWDSRTLDIDILFYHNQIIEQPGLKIPHPCMQTRRFVLTPLAEIAPHLVHPVLGVDIETLLQQCEDPLQVQHFTDSNE